MITNPRSILITGASGAIGAALAHSYAAPNVTLLLHGRDIARLQAVEQACLSLGAAVHCLPADLSAPDGARAWMAQVLATHTPDLVILNAGMNIHVQGAGENWLESEQLMQLNLLAVMGMADLVSRQMQQRQHGQIAFLSSLAGYFGLPVTPSYCASKAGVKAYAEAMRGFLAPRGIGVSVIMPGYVSSPMCAAMPGPKSFELSPDKAAKIIRRGLNRNQARISFPFPLNFGTWWLAVLPASISTWLVRLMGYGVK
ncbi:MAG: SDR family NAD(P)-dependent oxidoreductase [Halothiobacillaceae bacterium]|nr:SDR family NAD(P)-dependent oxidoreductase [Halothiobacillaceae bacterium]